MKYKFQKATIMGTRLKMGSWQFDMSKLSTYFKIEYNKVGVTYRY